MDKRGVNELLPHPRPGGLSAARPCCTTTVLRDVAMDGSLLMVTRIGRHGRGVAGGESLPTPYEPLMCMWCCTRPGPHRVGHIIVPGLACTRVESSGITAYQRSWFETCMYDAVLCRHHAAGHACLRKCTLCKAAKLASAECVGTPGARGHDRTAVLCVSHWQIEPASSCTANISYAAGRWRGRDVTAHCMAAASDNPWADGVGDVLRTRTVEAYVYGTVQHALNKKNLSCLSP